MADPRVDPEDVKTIIDTNLTDDQITACIYTANRLTNARLLDAPVDIAKDVLFEIEKYLAAHFITLREPQAASEDIGSGDYRVTYQGKTGSGLSSSMYGQTAQALDPSGRLAQVSQTRVIQLYTAGPPED